MLTKEECLKALCDMCLRCDSDWCDDVCENRKILAQLINEHFDNPPLKFEEIDDGIIVWDSLSKEYIEICDSFNEQKIFYKFGINIPYIFMFQENRFYRKQVEE